MHGATFSNQLTRGYIRGLFLVGFCVSVLIGMASSQDSVFPARFDNLFLDGFERFFASNEPARNAVVIDVDEESLAAAGQWPWPRYRIAAMIEAIARAHPAAIGVDVLFPEPDRSSLVDIERTFKRDFNVELSITGAPRGLLDNDGYLGSVIARTDTVGSQYLYFDHVTMADSEFDSGLLFQGRTDLLALDDAPGLLTNTDPIASQTRTSGFLNNQPDKDGRSRRLPLLIQHRGRIYASLALATFMKSLGQTSAEIEEDQNGPLIRVGSHHIPIDRTGFALMRFNGGASLYPSISALDILNGSYRGADLHGKMVFIGSSAVAQGDLLNTAFGPLFPGLKLQALMVEDMATDQFLRAPRWAPAAIWGACILSGALMAALFSTASGARTVLLGSGAAAVVPVVIAMALFGFLGIFVSPAAPFFNAALLSILFSAARFATERKRAILWFKRLENARQVAIESMAAVAETRDPETGAHIKRTQHYVKAIAEQLRQSGQYTGILTQEYIQLLFISAPLHDIGKVGVPDHILLKPARLTADEFEIMKLHAEFGRKIICSTASLIEGDNFLTIAGEIAATHHEKWDGTGYPLGLSGQDIPLSGRIMAVADIYDALISRRCYKEPFPHDVATGLMRKARGVNFDPAVLDAFFSIEEQIKQIAAMYRDEESAPIVEGLWPALERPVARPSLA